jgi:trans-2,3-dihydro-3-hydroxyanthranilate isomerase
VPEHRVTFLDVFAERPLAGNGLAVVDDADGLGDETMLAFALETRLSETTYVQTPSDEGADYRNRIWTPGEELPFAGHPSLGTAVAVARRRGLNEASFVQQTGAGLQPLEVKRESDDPERWTATMLQAETEFGPELDGGEAMRAGGLEPGDAADGLAPQLISTGVKHVIAPVADASALARCVPDYPAIDALIGPHGAVVLYLAHVDPDTGAARARSFSRVIELGEDPATGSAAGPLVAYASRRQGVDRIVVEQGEEMGRPSVIEAAVEDGRARVSGAVWPLIDGTVRLPDR